MNALDWKNLSLLFLKFGLILIRLISCLSGASGWTCGRSIVLGDSLIITWRSRIFGILGGDSRDWEGNMGRQFGRCEVRLQHQPTSVELSHFIIAAVIVHSLLRLKRQRQKGKSELCMLESFRKDGLRRRSAELLLGHERILLGLIDNILLLGDGSWELDSSLVTWRLLLLYLCLCLSLCFS